MLWAQREYCSWREELETPSSPQQNKRLGLPRALTLLAPQKHSTQEIRLLMTLVLSFEKLFMSFFLYLCTHHSPAVFQIKRIIFFKRKEKSKTVIHSKVNYDFLWFKLNISCLEMCFHSKLIKAAHTEAYLADVAGPGSFLLARRCQQNYWEGRPISRLDQQLKL